MICSSSPPEVFLGRNILAIFSKFTGEHSYRCVISIKPLYNFIEITLWHGCSCVNLLNIFRTPFYKNTYAGLLLDLGNCKFVFLKHYWFKNTNIFSYLPKTDPLAMPLRIRNERDFWYFYTERDHVAGFLPGINICNNQGLETPFGNLTK